MTITILRQLLDPLNVLAALAWIAAAGVVIHGVCLCNHMTRATSFLYKLGMVAITVNCSAIVLGPFFPRFDAIPSYQIILVGFALCRIADRRDTIRRPALPAPIKTEEFTR